MKPNNEKDSFKVTDKAFTEGGVIINSEFLNGLKVPEESIIKTIEILEKREIGVKKIIID